MKISVEWLKEYVDYDDSIERLEDILTEAGFPIEERLTVGDDTMLDIEVTSNRPDCLGHIGVAREVAAVSGCKFMMPEISFSETGKNIEEWTSVSNEAPDICSRYTARIIDDVKVGASPDWMVRRLNTIGVRSINNVVDITNYVLMEIGQPLHSFDYNLLTDGKIIVRRGNNNEKMTMIDHSNIELKPDMLVIADSEKAVALAGVMGGLDSEVSEKTKTVLLESAHFAPLSVRRTSRSLTLASESSFRFERDVDIEMLEWASRRGAALLSELAGGKVAVGMIDVWNKKDSGHEVTMRLSRVKTLLGVDIPTDYIMSVFERLGFQPKLDGEKIICQRPSWRKDIEREVDLIEEIIRIKGYNSLPTEKRIHIEIATPDKIQRSRKKITGTLNGCGFYETVSVGFLEDRYVKLFSEKDYEPVRVKDFTRKSNNALRHTLLGSLLSIRQRNQASGNGRCDMYELAATHRPANKSNELPVETIMLGLMTDGDFRELRGVVEVVVASLDKQVKVQCRAAEVQWAAPGAAGELLIGDKVIGVIGKLNTKIRNTFDLINDVCLAEIKFDELVALEGRVPKLKPLSRFPGITRDLSLVLDEDITWDKIESLIIQQEISDMRKVEFVDIFRGKGVPAGKKSLTLSMMFRQDEDTLTHEVVDDYQEKILGALRSEFSAELRS